MTASSSGLSAKKRDMVFGRGRPPYTRLEVLAVGKDGGLLIGWCGNHADSDDLIVIALVVGMSMEAAWI